MSKWLLYSALIGIIILAILFIFVFRSRHQFQQIRTILKFIHTQNNLSLIHFFNISKQQEALKELNIQEGTGYAYFPTAKAVTIEKNCANSTSLFDITAIAHEMGHAIAHSKNSKTMSLWYVLSLFERGVCWSILPLFIVGFIMTLIPNVAYIGTLLMNISTSFTIMILIARVINIPTEREASKYGLELLANSNMLTENELKMSKKMLSVALSTYIFAFYERLFNNFILAKKIIVKIFRKNKSSKRTKITKSDREVFELVKMIKEDNQLDTLPITDQQPTQQQEENIIKMPPLVDK